MKCLVALAAVLGAAGVAFAASSAISLTDSGPQPTTVTVEWGDRVTFTNGGTKTYRVSIPRLGVASPDLGPGSSFDQVFAVRAGSYPFRQQGGTLASGEVVVRVSGKLTLSAATTAVAYGKPAVLSGRSTQPGATVTIQQRPFGSSGDWADAAKLEPGADGSFSSRLPLAAGARFRALAADGQIRSDQVTVGVRPSVRVTVVARRARAGTKLRVTGRIAPRTAATSATLEQYDAKLKSWRTVSTNPVDRSGKATYSWTVSPGRTLLRVSLKRGMLAPGFEAGTSRWASVVGVAPNPAG